MEDSEAGKQLNKRRKKLLKKCPICGTEKYMLKIQVFCSEKCKQINKRKKADHAKRGEKYSDKHHD